MWGIGHDWFFPEVTIRCYLGAIIYGGHGAKVQMTKDRSRDVNPDSQQEQEASKEENNEKDPEGPNFQTTIMETTEESDAKAEQMIQQQGEIKFPTTMFMTMIDLLSCQVSGVYGEIYWTYFPDFYETVHIVHIYVDYMDFLIKSQSFQQNKTTTTLLL